ncbi:Peroxin-1 [Aphelenchoides besseyi]|nr:Peroxin-1 [Aphelenchoides besseyi]KAI6227087.1 Peroxin-1 [Aphelenchoides besseyi]
MAVLVTIAEHSLPNCFGYLSDTSNAFPHSNSFGIFHCSKVNENDGAACLALQIFANRPPFNFVHLNRTFIEQHGFKAGDQVRCLDVNGDVMLVQVMLDTVAHVPFCQWMEIVPESFNDWNIIVGRIAILIQPSNYQENTSCVIEEIFLSQIRVLQSGMRFVLHLSAGVTVNLRVAQVTPKSTSAVLVTNSTQVLVAPLSENGNHSASSTSSPPRSPTVDSRSLFRDPIGLFLSTKKHRPPMFLRVAPNPVDDSSKWNVPPSTIITLSHEESYVRMQLIQLYNAEVSCNQFATVIFLPQTGNGLNEELRPIYEFLRNEPPTSCCLSANLRSNELSPFVRFKCRFLRSVDVKKITTLKYTTSIEIEEKKLRSKLSDFFEQSSVFVPVIISPEGCQIKLQYEIDSSSYFLVRFQFSGLNPNCCGYFWPNKLPKLERHNEQMKLKTNNEVTKTTPENFALTFSEIFDFSFQRSSLLKFTQKLKTRLELDVHEEASLGHLLVVGNEGAGKTTALHLISWFLYEKIRVFVLKIDCNEFKGKSPETIAANLEARTTILQARRPSLLLFDNFDFLNSHVEDEDRRRFVSKVYSKIAQLVTDNRIQVVAATQSKKNLPDVLLNFNGSTFFTDVLELPTLTKENYAEVLDHLLPTEHFDWNSQLNSDARTERLERLKLGDVVKLCERLRLQFNKHPIGINELLEALETLPTAGRGKEVTKQNDSEKGFTFSDVGGCSEVKRKLQEVFLWPMRYPEIFKSAGIRVDHGAVLHGPSGCGKTILARAMGQETGFNVIFVKGPELLSKYIGASEENVRKVFERARQNRPSLVVFDEFDSLVPKRGHDNTGVTDRVVNQFLTELDGVDTSMDGVYVLAATNRIDLIDVALLRPGRLGQKIFVDLPNESERFEILRIQCRDVRLKSEESLRQLAAKTNGWSGAELRGLIVNALFDVTRNTTVGDEQSPEIDEQVLENAFKTLAESRRSHGPSKVVNMSRVTHA